MHADYTLLQKEVDLRLSFNIAESSTALSHRGKQVIAISIIHRNIQWPRPQTILTSRLTETNGAPRKQSDAAAPPPSPPSRLHLFLLSAPPIIRLPLHPRLFPCCFHLPRFVFIFLFSQEHDQFFGDMLVKLWAWTGSRWQLRKEK